MIRIANASAFWGDQPDAAVRLVTAEPELDFITFDYLAELSLSILAIVRAKDPDAGYARDFVDVVRSLVPFYQRGGKTRLIANAGGLDPERCATAIAEVLQAASLPHLRIAVVSGDNVLPLLLSANPDQSAGHNRGSDEKAGTFSNLETGDPLAGVADRLVTANAYLGAEAIAGALMAGAHIVITGRVADPSLTVGACLAHFRWKATDYDRVAGATIAGHLIECGTQACGGFSTDWLELPGSDDIGFPIAEVHADGSCVITKPAKSGGAVTFDTVREQLLYEVGDPGNYLSPDVTASFLSLRLAEAGADRVHVSGASGRAPPRDYKVSASYRDGYKAHGQLTVFGHDAAAKAQRAGESLLQRLKTRGCQFRETLVECVGTGASVKGIASRVPAGDLVEVGLRVSVAANDRPTVERFTKEIASLVTCGPQGITGYAAGRPKVMPIFGYWPCLIARTDVSAQWRMLA